MGHGYAPKYPGKPNPPPRPDWLGEERRLREVARIAEAHLAAYRRATENLRAFLREKDDPTRREAYVASLAATEHHAVALRAALDALGETP